MTAENQWALLYRKRSRLRREILQIYTNQTNFYSEKIKDLKDLNWFVRFLPDRALLDIIRWTRSRLRRVIEFTRFARKEPLARRSQVLQIYTNQTNIILKIIERFEKILIDSCPLKMPKAWKNTGRSLTTDYSDFTDYFNKTSHWRAWLNDFSDFNYNQINQINHCFFNEKSVFIWYICG